jgi:hypothetical protein
LFEHWLMMFPEVFAGNSRNYLHLKRNIFI